MRHAPHVTAVLLALLDTDPDGPSWARSWVEQTLRDNLPGYDESRGEDRLRGWSVGAAWGAETLVQSRPIVRGGDIDPVDDLLRTPASCVVAAFRVQSSEHAGVVAPPPVKLSRFRRWLGVREGRPLPAERANELRSQLPGFLARHQVDRGDTELVFLSFLAHLHAAGGLGKTYSPASQIREALAATIEGLELEPPHNMMVSDGRTFAMLHDGGGLLSFEPPPDMRSSRPGRMRGGGLDPNGPRTNLLLCSESPPEHAPQNGGERVAPGVLSIDVREPRKLERS